jgi:hypothetical protein
MHPEIVEIFEGPNPSAGEQAIRDTCPSDGQESCDCNDYVKTKEPTSSPTSSPTKKKNTA